MPELPDLVYIEKKLRPAILNRKIREVAVWEPIVIRMGVSGSFAEVLRGKTIRDLRRHGPFLRFALPPLEMIVHFMLAGFFRLDEKRVAGQQAGADNKSRPLKRRSREHCFSLDLGSDRHLQYFDSRRMGRIYVVEEAATAAIPGFDTQGVDLLSPEFTLEFFRERIQGRRHQVRVFLMEQSVMSAVGNAYADEILFTAGVHPKTRCDQLNLQQVHRLYRSVVSVLQWGIEKIEEADRGIDAKVRDHLKVRNRRGDPCPVCGSTIRRTGVLGYDSFYCPKCQPELRTHFVPWDKLS
jgi:formamidopyrimidine-DNA glycosylase